MALQLSGLASGFDWQTLVAQLSDVERAPQRRLLTEQSVLRQRNTAYGNIATQLAALKAKADALKTPSFFDTRLTRLGDSTVASAVAGSTSALGQYTYNFTQLATASTQQGAVNAGLKLNADDNVSGLVLSNASFATDITAGTFTVNGKQITVATTDTLQGVFDKISTATSGTVTAGYSNGTDTITLSSSSEIILGSATDTSNFLQAAKLNNNGTGTVASSSSLGVIQTSSTLATANFSTAISAGAGQFKINGVAVSYNAATDTVLDVMARINNSAAGVTASYDQVTDRFTLANDSTGDVGIALEDVTGNFLAATQLTTGTLTRGKDLLYTINGGSELRSRSNTISNADSTVPGLSVTALKVGLTTIDIASDTAKIKTAITDFVAEYNKVQALIDTQTASTTDAQGKVTAGILAGEREASEIASRLRSAVNAAVSGLSGNLKQLAGLGINSNGNDDSLALTDTAKLDAALSGNLNEVKELFTSAGGIAVSLGDYLERTSGDEGSLVAKQDRLTKESAGIDTQILDLERQVLANEQRLTEQFVAMERAQAQINQQMQFLSQRLGLQ